MGCGCSDEESAGRQATWPWPSLGSRPRRRRRRTSWTPWPSPHWREGRPTPRGGGERGGGAGRGGGGSTAPSHPTHPPTTTAAGAGVVSPTCATTVYMSLPRGAEWDPLLFPGCPNRARVPQVVVLASLRVAVPPPKPSSVPVPGSIPCHNCRLPLVPAPNCHPQPPSRLLFNSEDWVGGCVGGRAWTL